LGENTKQALQLSFNRFLRLVFQGSQVASNGGLILVRELDELLGCGEPTDEHLTDSRAGNARFSFADLLRQSADSRLAGYEGVNDAERATQGPTLRLIGAEGRELVVDQPPAIIGQGRRETGEARPLLLAVPGCGPSDVQSVCQQAGR
jgi:hypothetical protein